MLLLAREVLSTLETPVYLSVVVETSVVRAEDALPVSALAKEINEDDVGCEIDASTGPLVILPE